MNPLIAALVIAGQPSVTSSSTPELVEDRWYTAGELEAYFAARSGGAIRLSGTSNPDNRGFIHRLRKQRRPQRLIPQRFLSADAAQQIFSVDVRSYREFFEAPDFLTAKRKFYQDLYYSPRYQSHVAPYFFLDSWGQLFHPPVREIEYPPSDYFEPFGGAITTSVSSAYFDPGFQQDVDRLTQTELTFGNQLRLLSNGNAFIEKRRLIAAADSTVYVSVMFFGCDESSSALADALIEQAGKGLDVRLITERVYRKFFAYRCVERLLKNKVRVLVVGDSLSGESFGAAMHQKIWIRDDVEAIVGGQNILDYENESTGLNYANRDADLAVIGPAVIDVKQAFLRTWQRYAPEPAIEQAIAAGEAIKAEQRAGGIRGPQNYPAKLGDPATRMNGACRALTQGVLAEVEPIAPALLHHTKQAQNLIVLTTPDIPFDPTSAGGKRLAGTHIAAVHQALENESPARIVIISNGVGGGAGEVTLWFQWRVLKAREAEAGLGEKIAAQYLDLTSRRQARANRAQFERLIAANPKIEVWDYFRYHHAKIWYFDRIAAFVGSWNLDHNSADLNHEAGLLCMDVSLAQQLEKELARDLSNSTPVTGRKSP